MVFMGAFLGPQTAPGVFHFVPSFHLGTKVLIVDFTLLPPEPEQALEIEITSIITRCVFAIGRSRYNLIKIRR
jgi:hypothetical protein